MCKSSIKSYVVRNGRLSNGQKKLLETHLPNYKLNLDISHEPENSFLKNCNLEVGFGRGDILVHMAKNNPVIMGALQKNIFEHISLMAQEQLEVEFREEIQQLMQLQQMAQVNPQMAQSPEIQQQIMQMSMAIEARKAKLISDMTQEFKEEENKIMGDFGNDPIAKLKARELDLRAMDNEQKRTQAEQRLNLDKSKAMMNQDIQEEKLDQNEELAKLRANTSIEKTILGKTLPSSDKMPGNVAIIRKTGE